MTRFARAHGSKASNERQPEEATSWNVLKQQLLEQQTASKQKVEEASKPTKQPFVLKKIKSEATEWAEFEEVLDPMNKKLAKKKEKLGMSKKTMVDELLCDEQHSSKSKMHKIKNNNHLQNGKELAKKIKKIKVQEVKALNSGVKENLGSVVSKAKSSQVKLSIREKRKKKLKVLEKSRETSNPDSTDTIRKLKTSESVDGGEHKLTKRQLKRKTNMVKKQQVDGFVLKCPLKVDKKKKPIRVDPLENKKGEPKLTKEQKKKKKSQVERKQLGSTFSNAPTNEKVETIDQAQSNILKHPLKVDKKKKPIQVEPVEDRHHEEGEPKLSRQQKRKRKSQLKKQLGSTFSNASTTGNEGVQTNDETQPNIKWQVLQSKRQKRNLKRMADPTKMKERKRRKPRAESIILVLNGQKIEVTTFDGFPVRKEDADRLKELRKQMIANGIPPKEIEESIKTERRKAEKALSREKRQVCFHCRKGGHNLSECPELNEGSNQDAVASSGICFKCGSTEHTHFECRVVREQEFRFAKCFICQEQGHISRQCPDNPRGLYPKGGGCKVCGDVTHLKKDCPDLHEKKEQNVITLNTSRSDRLEALDEDLRKEDNRPAVCAPKNKTVKF